METDKHHRTLHYVEVIYLTDGVYHSRKFAHYPEEEAARMYVRTVNKLKKENKSALVSLREENHTMIRNDRF